MTGFHTFALTISSTVIFGLAGIEVVIPENVSIATTTLKLNVYSGKDIVDYQTVTDSNGNKQYKFIVLDASTNIFDEETKNYQYVKLYKILGLDEDGNYYIAKIKQLAYSEFNLNYPEQSKDIISLYRLTWNSEVTFVPFLADRKTAG